MKERPLSLLQFTYGSSCFAHAGLFAKGPDVQYLASFSLATACAVMVVVPARADDFAQVITHLRSVETMAASFVQTERDGKVRSGTLLLKKPGKIRFQYAPGTPVLIVGDGKALNFIDYSVKQVSRWPIGNSPLSFLIDPSKDIRSVARIVAGGNRGTVTVEARDPKHPEFGSLVLSFDRTQAAPGGLQLAGWVAQDAQANRTTVRLSGQRYDVPVNDRQFAWKDPRPTTQKR